MYHCIKKQDAKLVEKRIMDIPEIFVVKAEETGEKGKVFSKSRDYELLNTDTIYSAYQYFFHNRRLFAFYLGIIEETWKTSRFYHMSLDECIRRADLPW